MALAACSGAPAPQQWTFTPSITFPSITVASDASCQLPRPAYNTNDTLATKERQKTAAAEWDRRCTLLGAWGPRR
jgi:hypothetical protein